ncbi:ribosome hibernation-promoting factor, HPF/YfiA family [Paenibacillus pinistramenti]|uniref:ribosome hibernation-promoting factor, HPF/YfiA family n=1 Tax=Paenibacillus pinistramenti TaxID=1768003 RepID=UPI001108AD31|nr:ribosome-associated translation inhibitor RaiA [Paenibacillus pinistramenti]
MDKLSVRGQQIEVTGALRDYVSKKLSRLEKYFDAPPTSDTNVTLSVAKGVHTVEVTIPLPGVLLRAEDKSDDMYSSVDAVVDKLERQIRKYKTKVSRRRQSGLKGLSVEEPLDGSLLVETESEEEDYNGLEVVRTKRFTLKPMDVEEAILQMDLLGHNFFVFSNTESREVNVVYKRNDGRYGLIAQD